MRILLQSYAFWPSLGGVQKFVHSLYSYLRKANHKVRLVTANRILIGPGEEYRAFPWKDKRGVKLNRFGFTEIARDPRNIFVSMYSGLSYIRYRFYLWYFQPQVLHLIYINVDAVFAIRAKKKSGFKLLTSCRGSDILARDSQSPFMRQLVQDTLRASDAITAVSNEIAAKLKEILQNDKIPVFVIPNGIEWNDSRTMRPGSCVSKYFVFAGHMDENKNPQFVVRSFSEFWKKYPDYKLILIGNGPLLNSLKTTARDLGLHQAVEFRGAISSQDTMDSIASSVALIIASGREGCPNVILEAMSMRTVVIGSNRSGIREIIRHNENGLLFDYNRSDQLIECMERAIQSEKLRMRLIDSALITLRENHDQNKIMNRYVTLYEKLYGSERDAGAVSK